MLACAGAFSALTLLLVGRQERHACRKTELWGAGMAICLERVAGLHMSQLMPLPLWFYLLIPAHPGSPGKRAIKRVCVSLACAVTGS